MFADRMKEEEWNQLTCIPMSQHGILERAKDNLWSKRPAAGSPLTSDPEALT